LTSNGHLLVTRRIDVGFGMHETHYKRIIPHAFSKRNTDALQALLVLLKPFDISFFFTDDFSIYTKELPGENML